MSALVRPMVARRWLALGLGVSLGLGGVVTSGGCQSDCNDKAFAKDGLCMPTCPGIKCGDGICTRYVWPDGAWDAELKCETHKSCKADCSNADANLALAIFFDLLALDESLPNPANNATATASCPQGGQAIVSGSRYCQTVYGIKNCTHDVSYTFSNCGYTTAYPESDLTFASGQLRYDYSYVDPPPGGLIPNHVSGQITVSGTLSVGYLLDATLEPISESNCAVNFNQVAGEDMPFTGSMCGRTIVAPVYMPDDTQSP